MESHWEKWIWEERRCEKSSSKEGGWMGLMRRIDIQEDMHIQDAPTGQQTYTRPIRSHNVETSFFSNVHVKHFANGRGRKRGAEETAFGSRWSLQTDQRLTSVHFRIGLCITRFRISIDSIRHRLNTIWLVHQRT